MGTKGDTDSGATIDIKQELVGLFEKEDIVAYFDVTSSPDITPPLSGMCKIAEPRPGSKGQQYISLLFIIDAPDADSLRIAAECMKRIDEDRLTKCAPEITSALLMPETTVGDAYYMRHIDVLLTGPANREIRTLVGKIYEAIREVPCLEPGELVWWEGAGSALKGEGKLPGETAGHDSFMNRIKKRLGINPG